MTSHRWCLLVVCILLTVLHHTAQAQERRGNVGLGVQFGDPSGLSLRLYQNTDWAYDLLAAWDFNRFFFFSVHGVYERPLEDSPLHYYVGPGVVIRSDQGDAVLGLSVTLGTNFFIEPFEVFLQVAPRMDLFPRTNVGLGAGLGLRYYFD